MAALDYLARKINKAKWAPKPFMGPDDISADAVTLCLKTSGNTLSFWQCSIDTDDIAQIALALALGTDKDRLETFDVVLLRRDAFEAVGFILNPNPSTAETKMDDMQDRHVDMEQLTLVRLSVVASSIADRVKGNVDTYRFTRGQLIGLIVAAIDAKRIDRDSLGADARAALERKRPRG